MDIAVQQFIAGGCHLNRDTLQYIRNGSFSDVQAQEIFIPGAAFFSPHIVGSATV